MTRAISDDDGLLARAAAGDDAAFSALVRPLLPRLRRWAVVRTADVDEADDVVQETLIRMHRGLPRFRGGARLTSWAYRILANTATERARERARQRAIRSEEAEPAVEPAGDGPGPAERLHARRLAAVVREYFATLPPGQRAVLELVDHEGFRPVDVAEMLDLKAVTIRAHLFKARRAIRRKILERYPELMEGYER